MLIYVTKGSSIRHGYRNMNLFFLSLFLSVEEKNKHFIRPHLVYQVLGCIGIIFLFKYVLYFDRIYSNTLSCLLTPPLPL